MASVRRSRTRSTGALMVLGSSLAVQLGAAASASVLDDLAPPTVTAVRMSFAAVVLLALARPSLRRRDRGAWIAVVGFGVVLVACNVAFTEAIARIPLGTAVALEFVGPFAIAALGSRRARDVVWALVAAGGVVLVAEPGPTADLTGLGWALAAGASLGGYILLSRRTGEQTDGLDGLALAVAVAAVVAVPLGAPGLAALRPADLLAALPALAASALLGVVLAFALELVALRRTPPRVVAVLFSLEPGIGALVGLVLLGQTLPGVAVLGLGLVVVAAVAVPGGDLSPACSRRRSPPRPAGNPSAWTWSNPTSPTSSSSRSRSRRGSS